MTGPAPRRDFLRGLVSLPLIGGGVTLIGNPSAVAVPVTDDLLANYETFLSIEAERIAEERRPGLPRGRVTEFYNSAWSWPGWERGKPSSRAALVLSAVGCGWEGARL